MRALGGCSLVGAAVMSRLGLANAAKSAGCRSRSFPRKKFTCACDIAEPQSSGE